MSLPSPRELLKQIADFTDTLMEPARNFAESLGLPTPPKAAEVVEGLPELPELPLPGLEGEGKEKEREAEVEIEGQLGVVEKIEKEIELPETEAVKFREV